MTEEEWRRDFHSTNMMRHISARVSSRKGDLYGCACCRQLGKLLSEATLSLLLEVERRADDPERPAIDGETLTEAILKDRASSGFVYEAQFDAAILAMHWYWAADADVEGDAVAERDLFFVSALEAQSHLVRDIFGNPYRPVAFDPRWRSESAVSLARTVYDTRDFSLLPILADALEEAGCDHPDVLNHCREPNGVHVRGCWVVDGVLGKT